MPGIKERLPHEGGRMFLTDGGLETTLLFHEGIELPHFAAFDLLRTASGTRMLRAYYERYIAIAKAHGVGFVLESPTWRANPDWAAKLGYSRQALDAVNRDAIALMCDLREAHETDATPMPISGCVGPRGDGYVADLSMTADEAEAYHADQIGTFADAGVDLITVMTMTYAAEATGIARAAKAHGVPVSMGFTVETDGRLPSGQLLGEAIAELDACGAAPAYYMVNCAHPDHFRDTLAAGGAWRAASGRSAPTPRA